MKIRLVSINVKKLRLNWKYGLVCTSTKIKDGTKRYAVEVVDFSTGEVIDRSINLQDKTAANIAYGRFKIKYGRVDREEESD